MSEQERKSNDLTPFEAALAGLSPRVESFDRERLIFLAGQAAALRDRGAGVSPATTSAGGTPAPRWAWPTAFSAMTAVAAALLVMLCVRPATIVATGQPKDTASKFVVVTPDKVNAQTNEMPALATQRESGFADAAYPESDPALRAELERHGVDFGRPRFESGFAAASSSPIAMARGPMTYFELLNRLQGQGPAGQGSLKEMMR